MSMHYKFGFVLTDTKDYLRKVDLSYMDFISEEDKNSLSICYDSSGILYIEEDVNMRKSDRLMGLLLDNKIITESVSVIKWKEFPPIV